MEIDPAENEGTEMLTLHVPDNVSAWPIGSGLVLAVAAPPKDPDDNNDENGDEEDDNDDDEEPAVIREPDEC